ncbi:hypothetical protein DM47_2886 [Burkholderia mallei]|nr:hypothetical protein DM50_2439 [Burkholderia mallei]KOT11834.1 hypothetical protein DM77_3325 [Burkholderia mallei]KOT20528.1 hypothetical protein DM47_2886 [Burkholderia mallei]
MNRFATWLASSRTGVTVVSRRVNELLLIHDVLIQRERMVIIGFLTCQLLVNARACTTPPYFLLIFKRISCSGIV